MKKELTMELGRAHSADYRGSGIQYLVSRCGVVLMFLLGLTSLQGQEGRTPHLAVTSGMEQVCDRFGNITPLSDIRIKKTTSSTSSTESSPKTLLYTGCTAGYFKLYLEDNSGVENFATDPVHQARLDRICKVFQDLSAFITPANPNTSVNIWIRNIHYLTANTYSLGVASSYYTLMPNYNGILDGAVWQTINSGHDAFTNVVSPLHLTNFSNESTSAFYHGMIALNFDTYNWYTGPLTGGPTGNQYDLYSVALHEITHALGFTSLIDMNGGSRLASFLNSGNYYSRYDLRLQAANGLPLITNSGCSMYDYGYNSQLTPAAIAPNLNSCITNNTTCSTAARFVGNGVNQTVYTPNCFEPGGSLGHFEDQCLPTPQNDQYYIMSNAAYNAGQVGFTLKRAFRQEERDALCAIGYRVGTTFGTSGNLNNYATYTGGACGNSVAGTNDGVNSNGSFTYYGAINTSIPISNILANDYQSSGAPLSYECLQVVQGTTSSTLPSSGTATFNYVPTSAGIHILRYVPVSGTQRGNITYIIIAVINPSCPPSACNFVANGGFESHTNCGELEYNTPPAAVNCWTRFALTPDLATYNCSTQAQFDLPVASGLWAEGNIDTWSPSISQTILGLWAGNYGYEAIQQQLPLTLTPGTYTLSFKARIIASTNGSMINSPGQLSFYGSPSTAPFLPIDMGVSNMSAMGFTVLHSQIVPSNYQWNIYSVTINVTSNINTLVIRHDTPMDNHNRFVLIDDIDINNNVPGYFELPDAPICETLTPFNLNTYVDIPNGTFSGDGVSAGVFNPAVAGVGNHLLAYTYTSNLGCIVNLVDNIEVSASPTVSVTGNPLICGGTQTYSASGLWDTYSWSNGSTLVSTPTYTIGQSGTYTLSVSNAAGNCTATASFNVSASPTMTLNVIGSTSICQNTALTLLANTTGGTAPLAYQWSNGSTTVVSNFTPTSVGLVSYSVNVTDANGCSLTAEYNVVSVDASQCCTAPVNYVRIGAPGKITKLSSVVAPSNTTGLLLPVTSALTMAQNVFIQGTLDVDMHYTFVNSNLRMGDGAEILVHDERVFKLLSTNVQAYCGKMWKGIKVYSTGQLYTGLAVGNSTQTIIRDAQYAICAQHDATVRLSDTWFANNFVGIYMPSQSNGANSDVYSTLTNLKFDGNSTLLSATAANFSATSITYSPLGISSNLSIGTRPFAGVLLAQQNKPHTFNSCTFNNLQQGVLANTCIKVELANSTFSTIEDRSYTINTNIAGLSMAGIAVCHLGGSAAGSELIVQHAVTPSTLSIGNVLGGVFVHLAKTCVKRQNIGGTTILPNYGIYAIAICTDIANVTDGIYSNVISVEEYGIRCNQHSGVYRIGYNNINVNNTTANNSATPTLFAGISLRGVSGNTYAGIINDNFINLQGQGVRRGIDALNVEQIRLFYNRIGINQTACISLSSSTGRSFSFEERAGISVANANGGYLNCNQVYTGTNYAPTLALATALQPQQNTWMGMRIDACLNTFISKNQTDGTLVGLFINNSCLGSVIRGNTFERHYWAFWCGANAVFPNQDFRGNLWRSLSSSTGDYNDWGTLSGQATWAMARSGLTSSALLTNVIIRTTHLGYTPPSNYLYTPPISAFVMAAGVSTQWFNPLLPVVVPTCPWNNAACPISPSVWDCYSTSTNTQLTQQELSLMTGNLSFAAYETEQNWTANEDLYDKLKLNLYLASNNTNQFLATYALSNQGLLFNIEEHKENALSISETYKLLLEDNSQQTTLYLDSLNVLENLYSLTAQVSFLTDIDQVKAILNQLSQDHSTLSDDFKVNLNAELNNAILENNNIPDPTQLEWNHKRVNEIALAHTFKGQTAFGDDELTDLQQIANECPISGGRAVYEARALLSDYQNVFYNNDSLCLVQNLVWKLHSPTKYLGIYPNPADGTVTINYPSLDDKDNLIITTLQGDVIYQTRLAANSTTVNLSLEDIPAGLYIVTLAEHHEWTDKLVIIH